MRPDDSAADLPCWNAETLSNLETYLAVEEAQENADTELRVQYQVALAETLSRLTVLHAKLLRQNGFTATLSVTLSSSVIRERALDFIQTTRNAMALISDRLTVLESLLSS